MQAVILAAGRGTRLSSLVKDRHKCLLKLHGIPIIEYHILMLTNVLRINPADIIVVGGYKIEEFNYLKNQDITLLYNDKYYLYNNIYSVYLVKDYVNSDFLLINCDTLYHAGIYKKIFKCESTCFAIDRNVSLEEDYMKVLIDSSGRIIRLGKELKSNVGGVYIGIAKININDSYILFSKIKKLLDSGKTDILYEYAVNCMLNRVNVYPVYVDGYPWVEIDTPEDYFKARDKAKYILRSLYSNSLNGNKV